MTSVYQRALTTPGARRFVLAGFVGRLPISMAGLGVVLYVQHTTGSYGTGGSVAAVGTLAEALLATRLGRALDRFGQARVLVPCVAGHLLGLAGLLAAVQTGAPRPLWYAAAALLGGLLPPVGGCVRARWSASLDDADVLRAAFALEAALDEAVFILGPIVATVLATAVAPSAGLLAAGALAALGAGALAAQRATDPGPHPPVRGAARVRVLRSPAPRALVLVHVAIGLAFGAVDLSAVAFARDEGFGALSGVMLGLYACGSGVSGLLFGARSSTLGPARRFLRCAAVMSAALWLPLAAPNAIAAVPLMLLAGASTAPTLISSNALMERLMPAGARTEGFAWLQMAVVTGIAAGAPLAGAVIDGHGGRMGFIVAGVAGVLVALGVAASRRALLATDSALAATDAPSPDQPTAAAVPAGPGPGTLPARPERPSLPVQPTASAGPTAGAAGPTGAPGQAPSCPAGACGPGGSPPPGDNIL
ncbi:MAG: MFS transporter [Frankia sp.]|nr:MFS transporter [Frankia sp.]